MNEIVLQVCNKCLDEKDVQHFPKHRLVCRTCMNDATRVWVKDNKDKDLAYKSHYWKVHGKQINIQRKDRNSEWYKNNREDKIAKAIFRKVGLTVNLLPPSLLAAKVEQLKLIHLIKELQDEECK